MPDSCSVVLCCLKFGLDTLCTLTRMLEHLHVVFLTAFILATRLQFWAFSSFMEGLVNQILLRVFQSNKVQEAVFLILPFYHQLIFNLKFEANIFNCNK